MRSTILGAGTPSPLSTFFLRHISNEFIDLTPSSLLPFSSVHEWFPFRRTVRSNMHGLLSDRGLKSKSQAKAVHGLLKADMREEKYFPDKCAVKQDLNVRAWIARCLEGSTNKGRGNEARYGRRWSLYLGSRLLTEVTTEDVEFRSNYKAR